MIFILGIIFFGARILFPDGNDNSDLVSDNYYENELAYQKVIDAKKNADNLPQKPQYAQLTEGIKITFPQEILNANSKVDFYPVSYTHLDVYKRQLLETLLLQ